ASMGMIYELLLNFMPAKHKMCSTGRYRKKQEDQNSNLTKSIWLEVIVTRKSNPVEHLISTLVGEFSCMRRRQRQPDSLASSAVIRGVLSELKECCPSLSTLPDCKSSHSLLNVITSLTKSTSQVSCPSSRDHLTTPRCAHVMSINTRDMTVA